MNIYQTYCLPRLTNCVCAAAPVARQRAKIVPQAEGRVLEVGMGTALNLPFYDRNRVTRVWGLEPSTGMRQAAAKNLRESGMDVQWLDLPAEEIPLEDGSVDTVLLTFTLCSIDDWRGALEEMRRVLTPGGKLLFCEHGAAPDPSILRWQHRLTPYWKHLAGGCRLDRPIPELIASAGFDIQTLESGYMDRVPRIVGYTYRGSAGRR